MEHVILSAEDIPMVTSTPNPTPAPLTDQHIVEHFADTGSSIMEAATAQPPPPSEGGIVPQIRYVNPFSDATNKVLEYTDNALAFVNEVHALITRKLQENIPAWIRSYVYSFATFFLTSGTFFAAFCLIGILAYETSFNCFKILGLTSPQHYEPLRKSKSQVEKETEGMTFDEKKKAQALVERKDKLNKEVERGGTWVWRASFAWFAGRLCFGDLGFWTQMAWGLLEVVVGFNVLPLVAALVACCVVPRAYLSTPWLCEKDEVAVNPAANAERSGLNGLAAPSGVLRDVLPRQRNAYEVDDDEETVRPGEYLNETKRVGYGRRAARANARGSRP